MKRLIGLLLALALIGAACGSDAEDATDDGETTETTATTEATTTTEAAMETTATTEASDEARQLLGGEEPGGADCGNRRSRLPAVDGGR